jgi:phosphatidylinositol alpha-1,6-mannosyltransferase
MVRLGISAERVWNIPEGGIDTEIFSSGSGSHIRKRYLVGDRDRMVFFAGRITKQKRIGDLLYAAKEVLKTLPGAAFLVAGEGNELPAAKALRSRLRLDDRVIFLGNVPYDEMPDYLSAGDVFALPSAYEGTARVLMESVAAGLPIVTTKVSGVSDFVVEGENGHIVSIGHPRELAERLVQVLVNIEHYRRGAARRKSALGLYDRQKNLPRVIEVWEQIARRNRK